ncbi:MAG TPA: hypothetical protein VK530_12345 [Candidatus Acidoferrum sp.]|nr:hypothetical protein [Candidatus Acidoferrum sp.]
MRIVGLMTFVCVLLMLAMLPAAFQLARVCGVQVSGGMSIAVVLVLVAGMITRRV